MMNGSLKKILLLAVIPVLALAMLLKGELVFYKALKGYLGFSGIKSSVVSDNGLQIFTLENNKPGSSNIVFIHGVGGNALSSWFQILPEISDSYNIVAPDLIYANMDEMTPATYDINIETELLKSLSKRLDGDVFLVGLSYGAWPALNYAATYPERVSGILLISPLVGGAEEIWENLKLPKENPGKEFYSRIFYSPPPIPDLFMGTNYTRTNKVFNGLKEFMPRLKLQGKLLEQKLWRISSPVHILYGSHDTIIPMWYVKDLAKKIPHSIVKHVPKAGHALVWDRPDFVISYLKSAVEN